MNEEMFAKILEGQGKISANIDDLKSRVDNQAGILIKQGDVLVRNTVTVEEHHKRSLFLEEEQKALAQRIDALEDGVEAQKTVKHFIKDLVKWVGYIGIATSATGGILAALYEIAKKLGL